MAWKHAAVLVASLASPALGHTAAVSEAMAADAHITRTWVGGFYNNSAGDPANWSPKGLPKPGDPVKMVSGTMKVVGGTLASNTLTLGDFLNPNDVDASFSLYSKARLVVTESAYSSTNAKFLVHGNNRLYLSDSFDGVIGASIILDPGSILYAGFRLEGSSLTISGGTGSQLRNDSVISLAGGHHFLYVPITGAGSFVVNYSAAYYFNAILELGGFVAHTQAFTIIADPFYGAQTLTIDNAPLFHGSIDLRASVVILHKAPVWSTFTYDGRTLTLLAGGKPVYSLPVVTPKLSYTKNDLVVTRSGTDTTLSTDATTMPD